MATNDKIKKLTCIVCPIGCQLTVTKTADGFAVTGNQCPRGKKYAVAEMTNPERILTTTVKVTGGLYPVVSVKTASPIPKDKLFAAMQKLRQVTVLAPVQVGAVILEDIVDTSVAVIATHNDPQL